jgi:xylan 1,4-beta-xylosidase
VNESDLKRALAAADLARVREALTAHPAWIEQTDEAGAPLFLYAGRAGDLPLIRHIVEYSRASLSASDRDGRNLLHYAAEGGSAECCRYLVERCGMDPLAPDRELETPYRTARRLHHAVLEAYFAGVVGAPLEEMYRNPVRRGMFADPSVARVGDDYYMVNSSFTYFPCIPVSHSRDLVHWRIIGHAVTRPEWAGLNRLASGCGYWAPDISCCGGRFYICATYRLNDGGAVCRKQMVVTAEHPEGPYT